MLTLSGVNRPTDTLYVVIVGLTALTLHVDVLLPTSANFTCGHIAAHKMLQFQLALYIAPTANQSLN